MRQRKVKRVLVTSLLVVLAVPIGGAANAYWTGSGSGGGSGASGTPLDVTLSPGAPAADLYPGGESNVVLTVSNPNAFVLQIGSLALDTSRGAGGFAVDAGHSTCDLSTLGFTMQTNDGAGWTLPAKVGAVDGVLSVTLANALTMGEGAVNACQGANATVYLAVGP
jgi:hypothetical protein